MKLSCALMRQTGRNSGVTSIDERFKSPDGGDGARSTPTVDGDRVYALSAHGRLVALNAQNGKALWNCDFRSVFSSETPRYGFCTSPIVDGGLLLVQTGGTRGNALAAFDKRSGNIVWSCEDDPCGYSSPITVTTLGETADGVLYRTRACLRLSERLGRSTGVTIGKPRLTSTPPHPSLSRPTESSSLQVTTLAPLSSRSRKLMVNLWLPRSGRAG